MEPERRPAPAFPTILLLVAFAAAAGAGESGVTVKTDGVPAAWMSNFAGPVRIGVESDRDGMLRVGFENYSWGVSRTIDVKAGEKRTFELPVFFVNRNAAFRWTMGGEHDRESISLPYNSRRGFVPLLCVNAFMMSPLQRTVESGGERMIQSILPQDFPFHWQSYVGFDGVPLFRAADLGGLAPRQVEALKTWILWLGGFMWVTGEGAEAALEKIGLPLASATVVDSPPVRAAYFANGGVFLADKPDVGTILGVREVAAPVLGDFFDRWRSSRIAGALLRGLGEIPTGLIIGALLLLGVLLGPVNYLYVRRRKNMLLFYVITPACAFLGTAAIIAGALLMEGMGGECNRMAVLAVRFGGGDGVLYDMRGVRPGFSVPAARFGEETLVLPFSRDSRGDKVTLDLSDGVRLESGWFKPRSATGILTVRPLVSRMNVEVASEGGARRVVNNLGHTLLSVAAKLPDGRYYWAENVPPGGTAAMEPERGPRRFEELAEKLEVFKTPSAPFREIVLIAEAEGLPYLESGGIDARLRDGGFFYVAAGNAGEVGWAPAALDEVGEADDE